MKYLLFEQGAVELLINYPGLQSLEFRLGTLFISYLQGRTDSLELDKIVSLKTKNGIIFASDKPVKTFLLIDLEQCNLKGCTDSEWLMICQKLFRFAIRFWNSMPLTSCERTFKNKAVVYPFPFTAGTAYHIVLRRSPEVQRLEKRGINKGLFAYRYDSERTSSLDKEEDPDFSTYRLGGEEYVSSIPELVQMSVSRKQRTNSSENSSKAINIIETEYTRSMDNFRYMPFRKQLENLTQSQRKVVECEAMGTPIRVEGPAGSGKTASLVLRAIRLLMTAKEKGENIKIAFFTHSRSTKESIENLFFSLTSRDWEDASNAQSIVFTTLLSYCSEYINVREDDLIDKDAYDAKQQQLYFIRDAYDAVKGEVFNTYKALMSPQAISFFESENTAQIVMMLQHEFSVRIKGMAEGDLERYKKLPPLESGLPLENDDDKDFIFRTYKTYQKMLEMLDVYDTDDVVLEALARLSAPLWRRKRVQTGFDYLFVDEMHLFNLNEQQVFHYLTKDAVLNDIPICFALDYSQAIGERGDISQNYFEKEIAVQDVEKHEYSTIFRSSQQITELCASITASGALLFHNFINPYKVCQSGFTAMDEQKSTMPVLYMCQSDKHMLRQLDEQVKGLINKYKCQPNEVAVISFGRELIDTDSDNLRIGGYEVNVIESRNDGVLLDNKRAVLLSYPEYVNGLEFSVVILLGVDSGRVPPSGINDISRNFLYYSSLNQLYLTCSRAKYCVIMLGSQVFGISDCLSHAIESRTLLVENAD